MLENKEDLISNLADFPHNSTKKKQTIFVNITLDPLLLNALRQKNWEVLDVRLLPVETIPERAEAVLATLQGARQGTILMAPLQLRQLELEAKICGLLVTKDTGAEDDTKAEAFDLDKLFDFKGSSAAARKQRKG